VSEEEPGGALDVLTILDLCEGVAGSYAARLLAEFGARVVKVERPGRGDWTRSSGPYVGPEGPETSIPFLALNAGKESLTLDYETEEGAAVLRRLAEEADGIIEDAPTRRRMELGLDAAALIGKVPRLVITQVEDNGSTGAVAYRLGLHAFLAALAGLWHAAQTEHGQLVAVEAAAAMASLVTAGPLGLSSANLDLAALRAAELIEDVEHPVAGGLAYPVALFSMSETPGGLGPAPALGEHNEEILHYLLGYEAAEIEALHARGVA
jgi:crotonobetainyl-CoA:carnitine CoA-transferase CaiB-like acyl-CoA transferase